MTPTIDQRKARQQGRLDQRCRGCGTTSAAGAYCTHCGGRDLEYRVHHPNPKPGEAGVRVAQWCEQDNRPRAEADQSHPMSRASRARRAASKERQAINGGSDAEGVSVVPSGAEDTP